jgi:signal peptidase II
VFVAVLAAIIVIIDQFSKQYIVQHMLVGMSIPVINDIFHITYILNAGAAFGLLQYQTYFLRIVAVIILGLIIYYYNKVLTQSTLLKWGAGLLSGGAVGNLIDRFRTGYVVDFFDFRIWPVFNVADIAIVTGVGLILIEILLLSKKKDEAHE